MKKVHLLPNVITAFGLSCGLFVIFKMCMTPLGEVDAYVLTSTAGILLLAAFADLLDGAVARAIHAQSSFGGHFDSLADAITFGVAPSVVVLKTFSVSSGTELSFFLTTSAMIFSVCGVLRLVRFNVANQVTDGNDKLEAAHKKNFTGLPIPAAAAAAVSANLFLVSPKFLQYVAMDDEVRAWILVGVMVFLGYLMICRLKFLSLKTLNLRVASFRTVFITVLGAAIFFYGVLHHFALVFFFSAWVYILLALVLSMIRMITGKRSKTLEDFEPEPDDIDWKE